MSINSFILDSIFLCTFPLSFFLVCLLYFVLSFPSFDTFCWFWCKQPFNRNPTLNFILFHSIFFFLPHTQKLKTTNLSNTLDPWRFNIKSISNSDKHKQFVSNNTSRKYLLTKKKEKKIATAHQYQIYNRNDTHKQQIGSSTFSIFITYKSKT